MITKVLSTINDNIYMNLHEECLLKYLINPLELFYTTELLKQSNSFIEQNIAENKEFANNCNINYIKF